MGGQFNPDSGSGPDHTALDYWIYGADATFRYEDIFRIQFEYAQRDNDLFFFGFPNDAKLLGRVGGCYVESEVLLNRCWHLSFVTRYDMQVSRTPQAAGERIAANGDRPANYYGRIELERRRRQLADDRR